MLKSFLAKGILLLYVCGCASNRPLPGNVTQGIRSPEAMKATLASQVVGRPVADAQKLMEAEGFTCSLFRQASFQYGPNGEHDTRHGIDYLSCRRDDPEPSSIWVGWVWTVALVVERDTVTEVLAYSYGLGP